jgi:hypothetical protein
VSRCWCWSRVGVVREVRASGPAMLVGVGCRVTHHGSSIWRGQSRVARHSFADDQRSTVRSGHGYSGSSSSSTSPVVGVMPISSARVVVSEFTHAVLARQRISPSRKP